MSLTVDASVVIAAFVDSGPAGEWAESVLRSDHLVAPHLMPVEVASILRRAVLAGDLTRDAAALAHIELQTLPIDLFPYAPIASRAWELAPNVTSYDGWYVALAELLDTDLATLDTRLARAPGPRCAFRTPSPPPDG